MTTANTYHSLNDYRVSTASTYENGSGSKLGAGAIVVALFLGVGSYFYFSTPQHSAAVKPAAGDMNYQAPAAPGGVAPADTVDHAAMSDALNSAAEAPVAPAADANAAQATATESAVSRTATSSKSDVAPAQPSQAAKPVQRAKEATKSVVTPTAQPAPAEDNSAIAAPDLSSPATVIAPAPSVAEPATNAAPEPMTSKPDAPSGVATGDGTGG